MNLPSDISAMYPGTFTLAGHAFSHGEINRFAAYARSAVFIPDMLFKFVLKVSDSAENRVRRRLAKSAHSSVLYRFAELYEKFYVAFPGLRLR